MKAIMRFFQKNGLLKLIGSFLLLMLIPWLYDKTQLDLFKYLIWIPIGYIAIAFIMFLVAGIIGAINDHKGIKSGMFDKKGKMIK